MNPMTLVSLFVIVLMVVLLICLELTKWSGKSRCTNCLGVVYTTDLQCKHCGFWFPARAETTLRWPALYILLLFVVVFILS